MVFFHRNTETAKPTEGFDIPPYHVESFPSGWHCVCNKHGFNCLSFTDAPGRKFTTLEDATEICERWNKRSNTEVTDRPLADGQQDRRVRRHLSEESMGTEIDSSWENQRLKEENERLRAQLEVVMAAMQAAVSKE